MLIVFIGLDKSSNRADLTVPAKMFMGFGYNPDLGLFGERLDMLNFFAWMKRLQDQYSSEWIVYDASGYYIVNRISPAKITQLGEKPAAKQILEVMVEEQDRPKRLEIMRNCELRRQFLQKLIGIAEINATYEDSREDFRQEKAYEQALAISLELFEQLATDKPDLVMQILPPNATASNRLYLPLEMAETLYLKTKYGVTGKFGPDGEKWFDQAILLLADEQQIPYTTYRCRSGPRKPGYLSDKRVIWTADPNESAINLLRIDADYREFVEQYTEPFREQTENLEQSVLRLKSALKEVTSDD